MTLQFLRRTLISLSRKNQPSIFTTPPYPLFSSSFSTLEEVTPTEDSSSAINDYSTTHHNFSLETALKTSNSLARFKDHDRSKLVLDYFRRRGFSNAQLEELVLCDPLVLSADLDKNVKVKVKKIVDLGFTDIDLAKLLCTVPGVLTMHRTAFSIASSISVLQNVLGSNDDVIRLLRTCNWFLCSDLEKTLLPNLKLMESCGISKLQIGRIIFSFPRFFLIKPEFMRDCMRRVDEMGLSRDSKMYIHGVRVLSSMTLKNWNSKLKLLRNLGFSENDILSVFRKTPNVFAISERKISAVSKLLLNSEGVDISYLIQHAELLVYSATTRIKPRLEIINALLSKNLIVVMPRMTSICKMNDDIFIQKFVSPYADEIGEVGEKFIASAGNKVPIMKS